MAPTIDVPEVVSVTSANVIEVDSDRFAEEVVDRSRDVPVVVDFWAAWCAPCRTLGPLLERAVEAREGDVVLAKVDVDRNPQLAARYRVQGIPAVKGFRDGDVVAEFVGAQPERQVEAFLDRLVPSEADRAAALGHRLHGSDPEAAREAYERALALDPDHRGAAVGLARHLAEDEPDRAVQLVQSHRPDPEAEQIVTLAELSRAGGDLERLRADVDAAPQDADARVQLGRVLAAAGHYEEAIEHLLAAVRAGGEAREPAREQLVSLFPIIGEDDPIVSDARKRLARALY